MSDLTKPLCDCPCGCEEQDDYTIEGWTCEVCFREHIESTDE